MLVVGAKRGDERGSRNGRYAGGDHDCWRSRPIEATIPLRGQLSTENGSTVWFVNAGTGDRPRLESTILLYYRDADLPRHPRPRHDQAETMSMAETNGGPKVLGDAWRAMWWMVLALGVAALAATYPRAFDVLRYVGAAYLAGLASRFHPPRPRDARRRQGDISEQPRTGSGSARPCWSRCRTRRRLAFYVAFFPLFIDQATFDGVATYARIMAGGAGAGVRLLHCGWSSRRRWRSVCSRIHLRVVSKRVRGCVALIGFSVKFALRKCEFPQIAELGFLSHLLPRARRLRCLTIWGIRQPQK